jgi:hypothetical protein
MHMLVSSSYRISFMHDHGLLKIDLSASLHVHRPEGVRRFERFYKQNRFIPNKTNILWMDKYKYFFFRIL